MGDQVGGIRSNTRSVLEHIPYLRRRARALARDRADVDDLVQDTLERALRSLPQLRPGSNIEAWLNTLMRHLFIDRRRVDKRTCAFGTLEELPSPGSEQRPAWFELCEADVHWGIAELPSAASMILSLRLIGRMSYSDIALHLGTSCGTVGTRLLRARRRLQRVLMARHLQPALLPSRGSCLSPAFQEGAGTARPAPIPNSGAIETCAIGESRTPTVLLSPDLNLDGRSS
jgi:RNA polymerase sigma-70 factor (ECF subfamily)